MGSLGGLILLLSALLSAVGTVHVIPVDRVDGATYCAPGVVTVEMPVSATPTLLVHEYLHVYDCLDDGELNGSPYPDGGLQWADDPPHVWVYWALGHPEQAARQIQKSPQ